MTTKAFLSLNQYVISSLTLAEWPSSLVIEVDMYTDSACCWRSAGAPFWQAANALSSVLAGRLSTSQ